MFNHILVPLDGSELAEQALPHARNLAKTNGATVHFVRVTSDHPEAAVSGLVGHPRAKRQTWRSLVSLSKPWLIGRETI